MFLLHAQIPNLNRNLQQRYLETLFAVNRTFYGIIRILIGLDIATVIYYHITADYCLLSPIYKLLSLTLTLTLTILTPITAIQPQPPSGATIFFCSTNIVLIYLQ